jgi:hypothetical protein
MLVSGPTLKHTPPTVALDFLWKPPGAAPSAPAPLTAQAGSIGIALQALVLGSCLQLVSSLPIRFRRGLTHTSDHPILPPTYT